MTENMFPPGEDTVATPTSTVTRSLIVSLIDALVHTLGSSDYCLVQEDQHYRRLVTLQVETVLRLADEIQLDLWAETAAPVGQDDLPIALLLREADARFGMPQLCAVPGCAAVPVLCSRRPHYLATGTTWPSGPELCSSHTAVRLEVLTRRVRVHSRTIEDSSTQRACRYPKCCLSSRRQKSWAAWVAVSRLTRDQ
jgi:hypothetical protein